MAEPDYFIGLISGTSVDGVDCALVQFLDERPELLATHAHDYPADLRDQVLQLCTGDAVTLKQLGQTHVALGKLFAEATNALLAEAGIAPSKISAIGSHGQTIWHEPTGDDPFTLQISDPNTIAQLTGITTVSDLRGRDMAAGGQGAPLAPVLHREVFASDNVDRAIVNIGGIGNITVLPRSGECLAFDTGPGNVLMDYWVQKHLGKSYDADGEWAASGQFRIELLNVLLQEDYFKQSPPKSTGRELFNGSWLENKLAAFPEPFKAEDVQASLLTFTATTIVSDLSRYASVQEVYVCGGGAHNGALMAELTKLAGENSVHSTAKLGIDPDWVEAMCFAFLAKQTLAGKAIATSPFTGATEPVILGAIYQA